METRQMCEVQGQDAGLFLGATEQEVCHSRSLALTLANHPDAPQPGVTH